ncbi:MAG: 4a-hydroxytetrahydrobiopterin dehydratase [Phycisphaeraceae bacterium]|nr:4a-hydroxytetrahydrobiopterin dehydratase [Phycisphaeraceae bacterium]
MERLTEDQIAKRLKSLQEWNLNGGEIQRTFQFKDFLESMRFVNRIADEAERVQHHPDILVRWNKVTLTLSTHDAGGITEKDFSLAAQADALAKGP